MVKGGSVRRRGVYFLANDQVLDLAIAFLNSFRTYNPEVALCLIPFGSDIARISALRERYGFTLWRDTGRLRSCDETSRAFHDRTAGHYRKLAMWDGPFDEFVYIDCDTVVLHSIDFVFGYLDAFDFVASHSNLSHTRRWVWRDSMCATGTLTEAQISYAASTGFLASRRECLPAAQIAERLPAARRLAPHMELLCFEQPLLNYLIVTSGRRYTSLSMIAGTAGTGEVPAERWAGDLSLEVRDGRVVNPVSPTLLVHWAGEWARAAREGHQVPYLDLWRFYRCGPGSGGGAGPRPV
jgi:hypothetical protein